MHKEIFIFITKTAAHVSWTVEKLNSKRQYVLSTRASEKKKENIVSLYNQIVKGSPNICFVHLTVLCSFVFCFSRIFILVTIWSRFVYYIRMWRIYVSSSMHSFTWLWFCIHFPLLWLRVCCPLKTRPNKRQTKKKGEERNDIIYNTFSILI